MLLLCYSSYVLLYVGKYNPLSGGRWTPNSLATLVYAVVNSRIDCCNTVLAAAPRTVTGKLQRVLNAAARVVTGTWKFDRGLGQTNFTGSTFPTGCFSSWQWQFTGVWTAAHCRTCRTTVFRPPVLTLGAVSGICVPPTVNYLQYLGSTLTAVGPFQLPAPQSGTLSRISSRARPSVQTVSDFA